MTLTNKEIFARAQLDAKFRMTFLKALVKIAMKEDPNIVKKAYEKVLEEK